MTSTDPQGTPPSETDVSSREASVEAAVRPSAPVLSLEASKAQRQREKAQAAAPEGEAGPPRPRKPKEPLPAPLPEPASDEAAPVAHAEADAKPNAPRLQGVQADGTIGPKVSSPPAKAPAAKAPAPAKGKPGPAPAAPAAPPPTAAPAAPPTPARPAATVARPRERHWLVLVSFVALVILPTALTAWYAWTRAAPRFVSSAAFSVRTEDQGSAMSILGGVAALAGGSSSSTDTDVLYEFIRSQQIVELIDDRLDLRALWSKGDPSRDPIFAYHAPGTIEDLHDYWNRMVAVYNDSGSGLLDIQAQAFTAEDAHAITQAIEEESTTLVNRLSAIAQEDATRYAEDELAVAVERLKAARAAMTRFRNETQMVDPATAVASQMGLLSSLEAQLAQTLIDLDLLRQTAPSGDPRITQAEARVGVIEARMASERAELGLGSAAGLPGAEPTAGGEAFADLVGQFESLAVDQEFASTAYTAALATYDTAVAESRRQSRYLASHIQPTLAERAAYPARVTLTALTFAFALLAWTILALGGYALRDRR